MSRTKNRDIEQYDHADKERLNNHGGFGEWREAISYHPNDLEEILREA